jgi:hypothetical protein
MSSSSFAATVAPSVRIVPATALARARVSGVRTVLSAADRDSVVGVVTVVCRSDAEVGHAGGPVWLVRPLGYHHLRRAGIGPRYREDLCLDAAAAIEARLGTISPIDPR